MKITTVKIQNTKITYAQAKYLKHAGLLVDAKVTVYVRNGEVWVTIRKCRFNRFEAALRFLQEDSRAIAQLSQWEVL